LILIKKMDDEMVLKIRKLERYAGFPLRKKDVTIESKESHDETFSYGLCQRFYGKENELKKGIKMGNDILRELSKDKKNTKQIEMLYSLVGNMYYLSGRFNYAAGYFMKCLSYNKEDISHWIGLLFCLRAMEEFELFEKGMFNFEKLNLAWKNDKEKELSQEKAVDLIRKAKEKYEEIKELTDDENVINIGKRCNCKCISCPNPTEGIVDEIPFEGIKEKIKKIGPDSNKIVITGGEPTIRKDIIEIIQTARKRFPNMPIVLLTNGIKFSNLPFTEEIISYNVEPIITIYGAKEIHSYITQTKGSYSKTISGIKNLIKMDKPFGIIIVIHKVNYRQIRPIIEYLISLDNKKHLIHFILQATEYTGLASENVKRLYVSISKIAPYINGAIEILESNSYNFSVLFPLCILKNHRLINKIMQKEGSERKYFSEKCKICVLRSNCNQIWESYIPYAGDEEIRTVTNEELKSWSQRD